MMMSNFNATNQVPGYMVLAGDPNVHQHEVVVGIPVVHQVVHMEPNPYPIIE